MSRRHRPALSVLGVLAVLPALAPAAALELSPLAAQLARGSPPANRASSNGAVTCTRIPSSANREIETAKFVAERLRAMGLAPRTGVAKTGVVAVIEGGRPGPVVAGPADMDGLPVTEEVDLPFASRKTTPWEGKQVGVMHACGHDSHVAMLLAAAEALTALRVELPGKVVLLFQPAEESVPLAEQPAGAELMMMEGVLDEPKVDVVFGLHVFSRVPAGTLGYRSGPLLAAADRFEIVVQGRQAHGSARLSSRRTRALASSASPWCGRA